MDGRCGHRTVPATDQAFAWSGMAHVKKLSRTSPRPTGLGPIHKLMTAKLELAHPKFPTLLACAEIQTGQITEEAEQLVAELLTPAWTS